VLTYTISGNVAGGVGEFDVILGAKVHAFADAVDVIANVTLIRLRIQELICTLEYSLLMRKPRHSVLRKLLKVSSLKSDKFTSSYHM